MSVVTGRDIFFEGELSADDAFVSLKRYVTTY